MFSSFFSIFQLGNEISNCIYGLHSSVLVFCLMKVILYSIKTPPGHFSLIPASSPICFKGIYVSRNDQRYIKVCPSVCLYICPQTLTLPVIFIQGTLFIYFFMCAYDLCQALSDDITLIIL